MALASRSRSRATREFDPASETVTLHVGGGHRKPPLWWNLDDLDHYSPHLPPHVGDQLVPHHIPLHRLELTSNGLTIPHPVLDKIETERMQLKEQARSICRILAQPAPRPDAPTTDRPAARPVPPRRVEHAPRLPMGNSRPGFNTRRRWLHKPPVSRTGFTCRKCGYPLATILATCGRHVGC